MYWVWASPFLAIFHLMTRKTDSHGNSMFSVEVTLRTNGVSSAEPDSVLLELHCGGILFSWQLSDL